MFNEYNILKFEVQFISFYFCIMSKNFFLLDATKIVTVFFSPEFCSYSLNFSLASILK